MTHLTTDAARPQEMVGPLIRGLAVLRSLTAAGGRMSAGDLVRETGLARSTVDRILSTLARLAYVRPDGRDTVLTPRLMELGNAYLAACRLPDVLGPLTDRLADDLDESVSLTISDRDGVRFIHQATHRRAMSAAFRVGDLVPAECAAAGALFATGWSEDDWRCWRLRREADPRSNGFPVASGKARQAAESFEERIAGARQDGWSLDDQLIEPGLVTFAMPVRDGTGRQVCAVSVVSHTSRHSAESLRQVALPQLRETIAAMEGMLAAMVPPAGPEPHARTASRGHPSKQELGPDFVESLARGFSVLTAFGELRTTMPLADLAEATGFARATARRYLITLAQLGYVTSEGKLFRLTPRVLELGFACLSGLTLPEIAQSHLTSLVERVHDSASMAVLTGDDIQYVARVPTVRIMSVDIGLGTRFPAHATSMGRVLLGGLPRGERAARLTHADLKPLTRHTITSAEQLSALLEKADRDGYALVEEELEEGLRSIAVPVRDRNGHVVAAINVSMHASQCTTEQTRESVLPPLRDAATHIEEDLQVARRYVKIPAL